MKTSLVEKKNEISIIRHIKVLNCG